MSKLCNSKIVPLCITVKLEALKITGPNDYQLLGRSVTKVFKCVLKLGLHQTSDLKEESGLHVRFEDTSWSNRHDSCTRVKIVSRIVNATDCFNCDFCLGRTAT